MASKEQIAKEVIQKLNDLKKDETLDKIENKIETLLEKHGMTRDVDYKISTRYKTQDSVVEKITRKNYIRSDQITDLMGIKIIVLNESQVKNIEQAMYNNFEIKEATNYYDKPKESGYKSLHMDVNIQNGTFELQSKDVVNNLKQSFCHDRIYKNNNIDNKFKDNINLKLNNEIDKHFQGKNLDLNYRFSKIEINKFENLLNNEINKTKTLEQRIKIAYEKSKNFKSKNEISKDKNIEL